MATRHLTASSRRWPADNPLRPRKAIAIRYGIYLLVVCAFVAIAIHLFVYRSDWSRLGGMEHIVTTIGWFVPDLTFFPKVIQPLLDTLLMAFWGTLLAMVMAIPVAYLAARNISPFYPSLYLTGRTLIVLSRSVHELIFALIFVAALGLGALPGILALACRSVGFMAKTTAEAIEQVDRRPIEAMESTGAKQFLVVRFGIVSQVFPIFVGNLIFQLDINLRRASILGMVGAGGIGLVFAEQMMMVAYDKAATVVLGIAAMVLLGEIISNRIRSYLI